MADDSERELPNLPLEDALKLVHLYAERGSPKYEKAALRWLERYLTEGPGSSTSRRSRLISRSSTPECGGWAAGGRKLDNHEAATD